MQNGLREPSAEHRLPEECGHHVIAFKWHVAPWQRPGGGDVGAQEPPPWATA